jgi:hypothetical protein
LRDHPAAAAAAAAAAAMILQPKKQPALALQQFQLASTSTVPLLLPLPL